MKVLSVGAGIEQVEFISKARELGHYVCGIDKRQDAEGNSLVDEMFNIDIAHEEEVVEFAFKNKIELVLPSPVGRYITTVGAINTKLSLPGVQKNQALICADKVIFNEVMSAEGIPCAKQLKAINKEEIYSCIKKLGVPCILKPRFGAGSKGILALTDSKYIDQCVNEHLSALDNDETLVETMITGNEYGVDIIVNRRQFEVLSVRKKYNTPFPYCQSTGYVNIINFSKIDRLKEIVSKFILAIEFNTGVIHVDIMDTGDDIYVIEASCRASGAMIFTRMVSAMYNSDIVSMSIQNLTNGSLPKLNNSIKEIGLFYFTFEKEGIVEEILYDSISKVSNLLEINLNLEKGKAVRKVKNGQDILNLGYMLLQGTEAEILDSVEKIKKCVRII